MTREGREDLERKKRFRNCCSLTLSQKRDVEGGKMGKQAPQQGPIFSSDKASGVHCKGRRGMTKASNSE